MSKISSAKRNKTRCKQSGVALIISLILLVIMTLLGIAGIRGITQQERMATQSYDRSVAFQATEATLREIELLVEANKPEPAAGCVLADGLMSCAAPAAADTPRWLQDSTTFDDWTDATVVGSGPLAVTPEYFVEYLGKDFPCRPGDDPTAMPPPPLDPKDCKRYRITARSNDGAGSRSYVMIQSIYATRDDD